jgi:integrase
MKIKLTTARLAKIQEGLAGDERKLIWDSDLVGFGARVSAKSIAFLVQHRIAQSGGKTKQRRLTIGKLNLQIKPKVGRQLIGEPGPDGERWTDKRARAAALVMLGSMKSGVDPRAEQAGPTGPTLQQAIDLHVANMKAGRGTRRRRKRPCSPRSIETLKDGLELHFATWLDKPLVDLGVAEIRTVVDRVESETPRRKGSNPENPPGRALSNRLLANLSAVWESADKLHDFDVKNPARRHGQAALEPSEQRISDAGFGAWYESVQKLAPVRRDLYMFCLFSAVRSEGVRHLRWEDVDHDEGLIHVAKAKGGRDYLIPLTDTLAEILDRRRAENVVLFDAHGGDAGWCFPTTTRARPFKVKPLQEPAADGIAGPQACRRSYNSVADEIGIGPDHRDRLMGHGGSGVNKRHYSKIENWDATADAAEKIEAAIWARIRGTHRKPKRRRKGSSNT